MQPRVCLAKSDAWFVAHQRPINLNASTTDENGYLIIAALKWNFLCAGVFLCMIYVGGGELFNKVADNDK